MTDSLIQGMPVIGFRVHFACGNKEAIAIAQAVSLDFVRAEGYVFSHIADEGFTDACAGQILRYKKQIGAENVSIWTDIKKKHSSHSITSDITLTETAKAVEFFLSDAIILTGTSTGHAANVNELKQLKLCSKLPIVVGSGASIENVENYLDADAFIIGSHFKSGGHWANDVEAGRVQAFMKKLNCMRTK